MDASAKQLQSRPMISVLIADDHRMMLDGLRFVLEKHDDIEVVDEALNGREAVRKAIALKPDVVIMDIGMPELNGIEATRQIHERCPDCRVLALSMHGDRTFIAQMLRAGAAGYILKSDAADELVTGVRKVMKGELFTSQRVTGSVVEDYRHRLTENNGLPELSTREKQVLQLLAEGHPNKVIADKLSLSVHTVDSHRRNLMKKLNLDSVAELTKYAVKHGISPL